MAKKKAGSAVVAADGSELGSAAAAMTRGIECGMLPGEEFTSYVDSADATEEADGSQDEPTETMTALPELPIGSLAEAIERAGTLPSSAVAQLRNSGYQWRGKFHGCVDVNLRLASEESDSLRRLRIALNRSSTRMRDGKHVESKADVIRWLMEQVTQQIEERASA